MKVIKRDGRIIDFDRSRINITIERANTEVRESEKATKEEIKEIIKYIEELDKKSILAEVIQEIIEQKLMEFGRYELAKKYIIYKYTRTIVMNSAPTFA